MIYKLRECIDINKIKNYMNNYYKMTGMPVQIEDSDGICIVDTGINEIESIIKAHKINSIEEFTIGPEDEFHEKFKDMNNGIKKIIIPIVYDNIQISKIIQYICLEYHHNDNFMEIIEKYIPVISFDKLNENLLFIRSMTGFLDELLKEKFTEKTSEKSDDIKSKEIFLSLEIFKTLIDLSPDVIVITGLDGIIFFASDTGLHLLGYEPDEIIGKNMMEFIHHQDRDKAMNNYRNLTYGLKMEAREYRILKHDGSFAFMSINGDIIKDEDGKPQNIFYICRDITKEKKIEEEIRRKDEIHRLISENIYDVVGLHDDKGCYTYISRSIREQLGFYPEDLIGKSPAEFIHPEDREKIIEVFRFMKQYRTVLKLPDYRFKNRRNEYVWVETMLRPIFNSKGEVQFFQSVSRNITRRKEMENELVDAKLKADEANKAKGLFLANLSHEIRTPLNSIIGFSDLLITLVTDEKQKNYIDTIRTSAKGFLSLINEILDLSKIESGKIQLRNEIVDLYSVINEINSIYKTKAEEKNIEFKIDKPIDLPQIIYIDETRLRQIMINLVGNAIKFTDKGFVNLSFKWKYVEDTKDFIDLDIVVEDTGIGISESFKNKIFEPFSQQDGNTTKKYGGTGLGLSITKKICEIMNGNIEYISSEGKGTIFTVSLKKVKIIYL